VKRKYPPWPPHHRWGGSNDLEAETRHREAEARRPDLLARFRRVTKRAGFWRTHGRGDLWAWCDPRESRRPRFSLWLALLLWLGIVAGTALAVELLMAQLSAALGSW
jgi:hypothetical protein